MNTLRRPAGVAVLLLVADFAAAAEASTPTFADVVDVRVVNLEVVVTKNGERVTGLGAGDFELRVDGKRVAIDYFTEVREGRAMTSEGTASMPSFDAGDPVGTRYLVFIDDFFAIPSHRDQVLGALHEQIDHLAPADKMALVAYDGRRTELLTGWTRSPSELTEAFERAMDRTAYGLRRRSELRRRGSPEAAASAGGDVYYSSFSSIGFQGSGRGTRPPGSLGLDVRDRISQVVRAAAATLRGFAAPAERKVLLLISGGWPAYPVEWMRRGMGAARVGEPFGDGLSDRYRVFKPLIETANRLGYTLYPVDLQSFGGLRSQSAELSMAETSRLPTTRRDVLHSDSRDALFNLAEATGGRAFEGAASRLALAQIVEDTRSFYWLGFTPQWQGDDASHRLKVRVRRPGVKVRSRTSFHDQSRRGEIDLMIEGAQLFDQPLPGQGEIDAELGTPRRAGRARMVVPLRVTVPLDKLTLLPGKNGFVAELELCVAARDDDGFPADVPAMTLKVERAAPPRAGEVEVFEVELRLRHQPHQLTVAVHEPATGTLLSKRLALEH